MHAADITTGVPRGSDVLISGSYASDFRRAQPVAAAIADLDAAAFGRRRRARSERSDSTGLIGKRVADTCSPLDLGLERGTITPAKM